MFDIGFTELMLIGVVALVVIGPERLPKVARTVGHLLGRMQRYVNDVKSDINREMQLDELKKLQSEVVESARSLESSVRQEMDAARSTFSGIGQDAQAALDELRATAEGHVSLETGAQGMANAEIQPAPVGASPGLSSDSAASQAVSASTFEPPAASSGATTAALLPRKFDQTTPVA